MKERPIIFSGPMVKAVCQGRKTQTRRIIKLPEDEDWVLLSSSIDEEGCVVFGDAPYPETIGRFETKCPYGLPGEKLWVRETFSKDRDGYVYCDCPWWPEVVGKKPSIHMPRKASRITLEITDLRVGRLQQLSEDDADAEGFGGDFPHKIMPELDPGDWYRGAKSIPECFRDIWEAINGNGSWIANPWVWVISFKQLDRQQQTAA